MKTILLTGGAGGVGSTTVTANLAAALQKAGNTVLVTEATFAKRALDLYLGVADSALYTMGDVLNEAIVCKRACVCPAQSRRLYILPGDSTHRTVAAQELSQLQKAAIPLQPDFLLLDADATVTDLAALAAVADLTIVVLTPTESAMRASEALASRLSGANARILVNGYHLKGTPHHPLSSIIERVHLPLLGVVPFSPSLACATESGRAIAWNRRRDNSKIAFQNIASRLAEENIPLFYRFRRIRRRRYLA